MDSKVIVYHGSCDIVRTPDIKHSYRNLDFGKGFYVTTVREQAERWARRKAGLSGGKAIVNQYLMSNNMDDFSVKTFSSDLMEWIDFVCDCRDGRLVYEKFDIIIGKVANDQVFRVVDMYKSGIWDKERAIREIKVYANYDQIAFISQDAIDKLLKYESYWEI